MRRRIRLQGDGDRRELLGAAAMAVMVACVALAWSSCRHGFVSRELKAASCAEFERKN